MRLSSDFHEDFIQLQSPLIDPSRRFCLPLTDLVCEVCPEAIDPEADAFVTNVNDALAQKVCDVSTRKRKSSVHQYANLDDHRGRS